MADRKVFISDSPKNPHVKRSPFDWSFVNNVTYKFGRVGVPYIQYCPPGTRVRIKPTFAFKLAPLVYPTQTNVRAHLKFYKVPLRILWENWEDFQSMIGTNGLPTNGGGTQFVVPYIKRSSGWNGLGSLAEQIGCSNLKLLENVSTDNYPAARHVLSFSQHMPFFSPSIPDVSCLDVDFGNSRHIHNTSIESYTSTFSLPILTISNSNSLPTGDMAVSVNIKKSDGTLQQVYSCNLTGVALANYASASGNVFTFSGTGSGSVSVDGSTAYRRYCYIRINSSDDFFLTVNRLVDSGVNVVFRFISNGAVSTVLFPTNTSAELSLASVTLNTPNKLDAQTGDITSTTNVSRIVNKLGVLNYVICGISFIDTTTDTKFDSIDGAEPLEPICALPFRALEFIHNYFMRNPRIDPFVLDGNPSYNKFLTNTASGGDSTTPIDSWNARYEDDYFTTCVKEPQFGNAPLVGVTVNDLGDKGVLRFSDGVNSANDYSVEVPLDEDGAALPITMYKDIADRPNIARLQELISFGISINDLRNVSTFQRMLERMQRTGHRYANVVYEFFGTNPPVGDHYPRYLGGCTRNISVDEITNVALSENAKLGEFAGRASFSGQGRTIKAFCSEASYIIGIMYFTVTPTYSQYLPPHLTYKHPLDFYLNPDFAYMGPQPVRKLFVAPNQLSAEHINDIFGYNRPYAELTSRVDEVHGLFKTDMANFLLQRMFGDAPELNKSFIDINADDLLNIFSVTENTDKIWGQIYFKVNASLPFPRSYAPRTV